MKRCAPTLLALGGTYANKVEFLVENILPFAFPFGIGQTNTSGSSRIDRYSLWKSPPRASFRVVHSKSHKIHFGAL